MTDAELSVLFDRFLRLPAGTEIVEFKQLSRSFNFEQFGQYFSALSNEANIRGHGAAWLVLGVNDDKEQGFDFHPDPTSLTAFKDELAAKGGSDLKIRQIYKLPKAEGKTILFFEIPPALQGVPTSWEGRCYTRNGEKLDVLSFYKLETIRGQAHRRPFEEDIALDGQTSDQVLELLDWDELFCLFNLPVPTTKSSVLDRLQQERLISRNGRYYDITNLGGLLFARNLMAFPGLANKAVRVIFYADNSRLEPIFEQTWNEGYALAFEKIGPYVNSNLPDNRGAKNVSGNAATPVYSELALSELIANALIHQNFVVTSSSPLVEVFDNRIEVSSPGRPLIDTNRFLDHPLRSRNKTLAGIMRRLNFCEEQGSGIDKVIAECEKHRLPPPEFLVGENSTRSVLYSPQDFNKMCQEDKIRACYQHASLKYMSGEFMTYQSLCERLDIKSADFCVTLRVIDDTIEAGFIQPCDPENESRKHAMYRPFWA
jgi:ATP-dependent DNA helicase RecG